MSLTKHWPTEKCAFNCCFIDPHSYVEMGSKPPTQTQKFKTLQKLILSYFNNVVHLLSQLTDNDMLHLAISESAKIIPYIVSSRQTVKLYLKVRIAPKCFERWRIFNTSLQKCLELWSSAQDRIRIASFLAIRKLASLTDESIMDSVLKVRTLLFSYL